MRTARQLGRLPSEFLSGSVRREPTAAEMQVIRLYEMYNPYLDDVITFGMLRILQTQYLAGGVNLELDDLMPSWMLRRWCGRNPPPPKSDAERAWELAHVIESEGRGEEFDRLRDGLE